MIPIRLHLHNEGITDEEEGEETGTRWGGHATDV